MSDLSNLDNASYHSFALTSKKPAIAYNFWQNENTGEVYASLKTMSKLFPGSSREIRSLSDDLKIALLTEPTDNSPMTLYSSKAVSKMAEKYDPEMAEYFRDLVTLMTPSKMGGFKLIHPVNDIKVPKATELTSETSVEELDLALPGSKKLRQYQQELYSAAEGQAITGSGTISDLLEAMGMELELPEKQEVSRRLASLMSAHNVEAVINKVNMGKGEVNIYSTDAIPFLRVVLDAFEV